MWSPSAPLPSGRLFLPDAAPDAATYTRVAIALHWLIAAALLAQIALGVWMLDVPKSPPGPRAYWFNVHKSIGISLGMLVLVRIAWRLAHRPPPLPRTLPAWQRRAANVNHAALYACLVIMPLTGYLGSSFSGYPVRYFGWTLPQWGWPEPAMKEILSTLHYATAWIFVALIGVHVAAALKHALLDRDRVLRRMWPARRAAP